ncbi:MAG: pyruvate, phosphate dikinase, partial [Acetobacter sp.]|nr:pyruvate, phosphate dikinase [Acetobacter sp.]
MTTKWIYSFDKEQSEGNAQMRNLLGGKGANLAEMANIGLPVPPGFTITTEVCTAFYENGRQYPPGLEKQLEEALYKVETRMGLRFGDPKNP